MRRFFPFFAVLFLACETTEFTPLGPGASAWTTKVDIEVLFANGADAIPPNPCIIHAVSRTTPDHRLAELFLGAVGLPLAEGVFCFPNCPVGFPNCPSDCPSTTTMRVDIDAAAFNENTGLQEVVDTLPGLSCPTLNPGSPDPDDAEPLEPYDPREFFVLALQDSFGRAFDCFDFTQIFQDKTDAIAGPPDFKWNIDVRVDQNGICAEWPVDDADPDPTSTPENNDKGGFKQIVLTIRQR